MAKISLDLGCGNALKNPFNTDIVFGIDIFSTKNVIQLDLRYEAIPFPDKSIGYVTAYDFLEHMPRLFYDVERKSHINSFIHVMNESSRVLADGGLFLHSTPIFPHEDAFIDPTHVNFLTSNSFIYFASVPDHLVSLTKDYGIATRFKILKREIKGSHLVQIFEKYA